MPIEAFPPHEDADESGLLAIGGDLEVESLLLAYTSGIFPWPIDENVLAWFSPPERTILWLKDFHIPRSLAKQRARANFDFTIDRAFDQVIDQCRAAQNRFDSKGRPQRGTWISADIVKAYKRFHRAGYAHSVECWQDGALVGGLYGVSIGAMFAGESMFFEVSGASKLALCFLVEHLRTRKVDWIDCQVTTPLFESFGAVEVPRDDFLKLLRLTLKRKVQVFA